MARTYRRDSSGRFAGGGGGGGGGGRPKAKAAPRGVNRLTRDNAGKITSVGGNGATARGGRIRTASGKLRATQTASLKGGARAGTIKGTVKRNPGVGAKLVGAGKRSGPRDNIQQTRRALDRAATRLESARRVRSEGSKALDKMRKKGSNPDDRKQLSRKVNRATKSIAKLENAAYDYRLRLQKEQNKKQFELQKRTDKKAPSNARTKKNSIRTQQRKVTYITKTRGFAAGRADRAKLRQMLGMPSIKRVSAGVSVIADRIPISRGRLKSLAARSASG